MPPPRSEEVHVGFRSGTLRRAISPNRPFHGAPRDGDFSKTPVGRSGELELYVSQCGCVVFFFILHV